MSSNSREFAPRGSRRESIGQTCAPISHEAAGGRNKGKKHDVSFRLPHKTPKKTKRKSQTIQIRDIESCRAMSSGVRRRRRLFGDLFTNKDDRINGASHHSMGVDAEDDELIVFEEDVSVFTNQKMHVNHNNRLHTLDENHIDDIEGGNNSNNGDMSEQQPPLQYRLTNQQPPPNSLLTLIGSYTNPNGREQACPCLQTSFTSDRIATKYLHWAFRSPFLFVFFSAALNFFSLTFLFAFFYWIIGLNYPECIGGVDFANDRGKFTDAYALSWTTFSTVGYGLIYPAIESKKEVAYFCTGITILTALESFVGILFASVFGAIMIAKVGRVQSYAQVTFSDPILVRFGNGVRGENQDSSSEDSDSQNSGSRDASALEKLFIPCPILEFRIHNRLDSLEGGEVIDASINIVASVDIRQMGDDLRGGNKGRKKKGKKGGKKGGAGGAGPKLLDRRSVNCTEEDRNAILRRSRSIQQVLHADKNIGYNAQAFEEDGLTGRLIPKRVFTKLEAESMDHPFFKRVWNVRHIVDENSPLLKPQVRELIKENNGFWPHELNNHEGVRASIKFDQILVSFSGTSNADANSVYAQRVYHYINMNVGYRFVNVMYQDDDGELLVDHNLINDVIEQAGGGAEPFLHDEVDVRESEMLVL